MGQLHQAGALCIISSSKVLASLYVGARRGDRQPYQQSILLGLNAAVHRRPRERGFDVEFHQANAAPDVELIQMKWDGDLKPTGHKDNYDKLTDADMALIKSYFLISKTPENLN